MNKKENAKIRFYLWLAAAAVLILFLILEIARHSSKEDFFRYNCGIHVGYSYPNASKYEMGDFTLKEEINQLEVNWISGNVTVEVTNENQVYAKETEISNDDEKMRYLVENGKLIIQYQKAKLFSFGSWSKSKDLTVYIPKDMAENMKLLDIETTSADIDISRFNSRDIDIETVSGEINIKDLNAQTLDMESVSGDMRGSGIQADKLTAEMVSGSFDLEGIFEKVDLEAVSGDLKLDCGSLIDELDAETVSGDITLYVPEERGFTAELDSVSGDINTELSVTGKKDKLVYGNGSAKFDFETVSGDVWIKKR